MRDEAMRALDRGDAALALRLVFASDRTPDLSATLGLQSNFPLVGYRSAVENLERTAAAAASVARIVVDADEAPRAEATDRLRGFADRVDELSALAVESVVDRNYGRVSK